MLPTPAEVPVASAEAAVLVAVGVIVTAVGVVTVGAVATGVSRSKLLEGIGSIKPEVLCAQTQNGCVLAQQVMLKCACHAGHLRTTTSREACHRHGVPRESFRALWKLTSARIGASMAFC